MVIGAAYTSLQRAIARGVNSVPLADLAPPHESLLQRMDPTERAAVLAALIGLVIMGVALVLFVWLGGRFVRRRSMATRGRSGLLPSDWDRQQPTAGRPRRPEPE